jgi:DNA-binding response OmpR family regulator
VPVNGRLPASKTPASVAFGRFRVLPHRLELLADGSPVKLGGRAFDVLITLLEGPGRVVNSDELIRRMGPNRVAPAIGCMVEAVLPLFLVTVVRGRRE